MKRLAAITISVLLFVGVFSSAFSVPASGAEAKAGSQKAATEPEVQTKPLLGKDALEKAIALVKSRMEIPAAYTEFNGDVYDNGGKTQFRLRWSSGSYSLSPVNGSVQVTVDENGVVSDYYAYSSDRSYDGIRRLPSLTAGQAADRAGKFLAAMCPDIAGQVSYDKGVKNCNVEYDGSYSFYFYRLANGIPFYDNSVYMQVNGRTGAITSMSRNWDDSLVFPKPDAVIPVEKAAEAWKKDIRLRYRLISGKGGLSTTLQYAPPPQNIAYAIDASTGGKIAVNTAYNPYYDYVYRPETFYDALSDSEIDKLMDTEDIMTPEEGEKLARSISELSIDGAYSLNSYSYSRMADGGYSLRLEFIKAPSPEDYGKDIPPEKLKALMASGGGGSYANLIFDAGTSELISFNDGVGDTGAAAEKRLTRQELQQMADAFLKKYKGARFSQTELAMSTPYANDYMLKFGIADPGNTGGFMYERKANGITVEGNGLNISLDTATGRVISFSETWDDVPFVSANGIIGIDRAYKALLEQNVLELKYAAEMDPGINREQSFAYKGKPVSPVIKLVYSPGISKPVVLDAFKGILVNGGTGEEYLDKNEIDYPDLAGNPYKEDIESLVKSGLIPLEKSFRPGEPMLQKDFLCMLFLLKGNSVQGISTGEMTQTEQDGMYRQLINDGLLTGEEEEPDAVLTKEQAVKFLLKSVGYGKFAELKGIFDCGFTDRAEISPELLGYAAIAGSLGIVKEQAFEPGKKLTRLEAAMLVYAYMSR